MKKMFNKKFFLMLGSTITLLVVLSVAMIFLTKENTKTFTKEGYIIASSKEEASIKYYFDEGTSYKKNISSELVFEDKSGEKVTVAIDNFMHYTDGGLKFLKNGVIMDLDSINSSIVPYYNITDKSILEYSKKSYFIETIDKTLAFNNIAGRISENKYIFAGVNVKLQLAGNENIIEGDYFEVYYVEDGIIKVENKDVSYQTTAEDSFILVNDTTKINLGNKKIYFNGEEKMSLSQMTIDGNENIEIVPEEDEGGKGDGTGEGTGTDENPTDTPGENDGTSNPGTETPGEGGEPGEGDTQNPGQGDNVQGGENNQPGQEGTGTVVTSKQSASVELVKATVDATSLSASFVINDPDNIIENDLVIRLVNMDTGIEPEDSSARITKGSKEYLYGRNPLEPNTNYLLTVNEEKEGKVITQYFQKLFKTETLGIKLEKKYATENSLTFEAIFDEKSEVKSATLTLYDMNNKQVGTSQIVTPESNVATFDHNLTSDTSYKIVLDNVIVNSVEYADAYKIEKTFKTLKPAPYLEGLTTSVDDETNTFTVGVERVLDEKESITKFSYYIYEADKLNQENIDEILPIKIIEKLDKSKVNISIDNELILPKTNYKFKVVAEYYDNEKYGEFETELSDNFILSGKPKVDFVQNKDETTFNKIVGTIVLHDDSCTVPMNGRECSSVKWHINNFELEYKITNSSEKNVIKGINFNVNTLEAPLEVNNLLANTEYVFNLYGDVDLLDGQGLREKYLIGSFRASTNSIEILTVDWQQNTSTKEDLINVSAKIRASGENQNLGDSIANMTINLYSGDVADQIKAGATIEPLVSKQLHIENREEYYNNFFTINTLNTFGITDQEKEIVDEETGDITYEIIKAIDVLKSMTNDSLLTNYTIEITDVFDEEFKNQLPIENNYFKFITPPLFRLEYELEMPTISAEAIENQMLKTPTKPTETEDETLNQNYEAQKELVAKLEEVLGTKYNRHLADTIIVGYKVNAIASVDRISQYLPVKELIYYVCAEDKVRNCEISEAIETRVIDVTQTTDFETYFFVDQGTRHGVNDEKLARGHNYVFKLKFSLDTDNDGIADTYYPNNEVQTSLKKTPKQAPSYKVYVFNTTPNQANYKINYFDFDNALYEQKIYYTINDELKNQIPEEPEPPVEPEVPEVPGDGTEEENPEITPQEETTPDAGEDDNTTGDNVTGDGTDEPSTDEPTEEPEVPIVPEPEEKEYEADFKNCVSIKDPVTYRTDTECDFTLDGLNIDSVYKIAFKKALARGQSNITKEKLGDYIFDGEFVYETDTVTFTNVTSDNDNRLRIRINETKLNEKYVNRISAYEILLTADGVDDYTKIYPTDAISACEEGEESYKCIIVDYADIKEFKTKDITVKVTAYYDSGIIDNAFVNSTSDVSSELTNEIGYILQKNNVFNEKLERAEYIHIIASGGATAVKYPSGIYGFGYAAKKRIELIRKIDLATYTFAKEPSKYNYTVSYTNTAVNIPGTSGVHEINNKLLSSVDLATAKDTFKFNSIIPKVNVTYKGLVNGAQITMKLTGVDEEILKNEFKEEDGKYYLYVDIYKNEDKTGGVYKSEKIEIDLEKGSVLELTKYMPDTTYYYEVSAYLLKENDYKKTALFDAGNSKDYEAKLYEFATLKPTGIYPSYTKPAANYTTTSNTSTGVYTNRNLNLTMVSNKNIGEFETRFELYDINENLILTETVAPKSESGAIVSRVTKDITPTKEEMDNNGVGGYLFGDAGYNMKIYIITNVFETEENPEGKAELLVYETPITLKKLSDPTYTIEKTETINSLTFKVSITDKDKVIKDGKYCAVLLSSSQQAIPGISPKCGLSALELKKSFTYNSLASDTLYTFKVYADVYTNNVDDTEQNREIYRNLLVSTSTNYGVALGLVTAYGSKTSVTLSFDSGVNITKIKQVDYTLFEQVDSGTGAVAIMSESYTMGKDKNFKTDGNTVELVINPSGLSLSSGYSYSIDIAFWVEQGGKLVKLNNKNYNYGVKFR